MYVDVVCPLSYQLENLHVDACACQEQLKEVCLHTYMCRYIHVYPHICIRVYMYIDVVCPLNRHLENLHMQICMYVHIHTHTHTHSIAKVLHTVSYSITSGITSDLKALHTCSNRITSELSTPTFCIRITRQDASDLLPFS
jgi:hypothetical protein